MNRFEIIEKAYKSRLLYNTADGYSREWGVGFETVADHRVDARAISRYYDILDKRCDEWVNAPLQKIVDDYSNASEAFNDLDWKGRSHRAMKKKFVRMLFRIAATRGLPMSSEEKEKFRFKEGDEKLLSIFFPNGIENTEAISVPFTLLFAFDILRPAAGMNGKGRDIKEETVRRSLELFEQLLLTLREDIPTVGTTAKPIAFDEILESVGQIRQSETGWMVCSPLWFYYQLLVLQYACLTVVDPNLRLTINERVIIPDLPGIWVDDKDAGRTRFWISPQNTVEIFCYSFNKPSESSTRGPQQHIERQKREIELFPFMLTMEADPEVGISKTAYMVNSEGIKRTLGQPGSLMERKNYVITKLKTEIEDTEPVRVYFDKSSTLNPDWFDWTCFRRLDTSDELYLQFSNLLKDVYSEGPGGNTILINHGALYSDIINNLIGRDQEFLYVYDYKRPEFRLEESEGEFEYWKHYPASRPVLSLFNLEISGNHPLYLLPVDLPERMARAQREYEEGVAKGRSVQPPSKWMRTLADLMQLSKYITQISIIPTESDDPILYFDDFDMSLPISLDDLRKFGGQVITEYNNR